MHSLFLGLLIPWTSSKIMLGTLLHRRHRRYNFASQWSLGSHWKVKTSIISKNVLATFKADGKALRLQLACSVSQRAAIGKDPPATLHSEAGSSAEPLGVFLQPRPGGFRTSGSFCLKGENSWNPLEEGKTPHTSRWRQARSHQKKRPPPCEFWDPLILAVTDTPCSYQRFDEEGTGDKRQNCPETRELVTGTPNTGFLTLESPLMTPKSHILCDHSLLQCPLLSSRRKDPSLLCRTNSSK